MTLGQLKALLAAEPPEHDGKEIEVWLPGSTIQLAGENGTLIARGDKLLIEGNLNPGSALGGD